MRTTVSSLLGFSLLSHSFALLPACKTALVVDMSPDDDGDGYAASEDCDDSDGSVHPDAEETWYDGVDQPCDGGSDYDQDGDGYESLADTPDGLGTDCDDTNPEVFPDATEVWYDGIDANCDQRSDDDQDGDGYDAIAAGGTDCDDLAASTSPASVDLIGDQIDNDCDGLTDEAPSDEDLDGDGFSQAAGDCNDSDAGVGPAATEIWYDGLDQDCDGWSDFDSDFDGFDNADHGGDDCDDEDSAVHPGQFEDHTNGIDDDCDGEVDEALSTADVDADGFSEVAGDCDDADGTVNPNAVEVWYDGIDQDCSGTSDFDQDADGAELDALGGTDCNDVDPTVSPAATEIWYDGVDQDCDGRDDDQDDDGHELADDCDDTDPAAFPGGSDPWYDGVDGDCLGNSDYDADGERIQLPELAADLAALRWLGLVGLADPVAARIEVDADCPTGPDILVCSDEDPDTAPTPVSSGRCALGLALDQLVRDGIAAVSAGDWARADELLTQAHRCAPENANVAAHLGWARSQNPSASPDQRALDGVRMVELALEIDADCALGWRYLGALAAARGDVGEATRCFKVALNLLGS